MNVFWSTNPKNVLCDSANKAENRLKAIKKVSRNHRCWKRGWNGLILFFIIGSQNIQSDRRGVIKNGDQEAKRKC